MKPTNVKSRILKRLIPVLLVPVVLSSNFAAIYVSADEETVQTQEAESNQNNSQENVNENNEAPEETAPVEEETPAEEVAASENETEEPVVTKGTEAEEDIVVTPDAAPGSENNDPEAEPGAEEQEDGEEEGEDAEEDAEELDDEEAEEEEEDPLLTGMEEEEKIPVEISVMLSADDNTAAKVSVSFVDSEGNEQPMTYGESNTVFAGFEGEDASAQFKFSASEEYAVTAQFGSDVYKNVNSLKVSLGDQADSEYKLTVSVVEKDTKQPKVTGDTFGKEGVTLSSYTDNAGKFTYSTDADDLQVTATAEDIAANSNQPASLVASMQVKVNDKWLDMELVEQSETTGKVQYKWAPESYGIYEIQEFKAVDGCGNESEPYAATKAPKYIAYYSGDEKDSLVPTHPVDSDSWFNSESGSEYKISFNGTTYRNVEKITVDGEGINQNSFSCTFDAGKRCYSVNAEYEVKPLTNLTATYDFKYQYKGDAEAKELYSHITKIDLDAIVPETIEAKLNPSTEYTDDGAFAVMNCELTVPAESEKVDSGKESGFKYASIEFEKEVYAFCFEISSSKITKSVYWREKDVADENDNYVYNFVVDKVSGKLPSCIYVRYKFKNIELSDRAGNKKTAGYKNGVFCDSEYFPPIIKYEGNLKSTSKTAKIDDVDWAFTNETVSGNLVIQDLAIVKVNFADMPGHTMGYDSYLSKTPEKKESPLFPEYSCEERYAFALENDGKYRMITEATDNLGLKSSEISPAVVIDKTKPTVTVKYDNGEYSRYFNKDHKGMNVTFVADELWIDPANTYVHLSGVTEDGKEVSIYSKDPVTGEELISWSGNFGELEHSISIPVDVDGTYHIDYCVTDYATNSTGVVTGEDFILDTKSPEYEIKYTGPEAKHDKYFNGTRTAIITVTDYTFNTAESKVPVNEQYGKATASDWKQLDGKTYEKTIVFDKDGIYSFSLTLKDLAGNSEVTKNVEEFVIDMTAPKIAVYYDNNSPKNEFYFNTARVATVEVEDLSFTGDMVSVAQAATEDAGVMPSLGGFSTSGLNSRAQMTFTEDGSYSYVINCEDLAGNQAEAFTADMFVIDRTIPEVKFSGVENFSANNGTVAPAVSYVDKHMDINASYITLTGSNNGVVDLANKVDRAENGFVVSYGDFEHVKGMDDLYILQAHVTDLAGNENKDQLVFSVNRFGSVFVLSEAAKALNEQYYTREPVDISITEINVDDLTQKTVSISRDGDIKELKSGKQYTVSRQGSDTTWKTYTYTVSKDNFEKDGIYSVTVYTKDRATNIQDNKSRDAEINFAVDKTAPSIVTAGLDNGEVYKETSHTVNIDVTDNMGVTSLTVFKDGKEIGFYDEEALLEDNGQESITLAESDEKQSIRLVAEDVAGNIETVEYTDILVSTKETEIIPEIIDSENDTEIEPGVLGSRRANGIAGFIVLALGVIAAGTGAGVTLYKKKQTSTTED